MTQAERMLQAANEFYRAAVRCGRTLEDGWLPHPQIVNFAFAAEVALKGLRLVHNGDTWRGHALDAIFKDLPTAVQDRVRGSEMPTALFLDRLGSVARAFEDWRYAYEQGSMSVSIEFLDGIAHSAIAVLRDDIEA